MKIINRLEALDILNKETKNSMEYLGLNSLTISLDLMYSKSTKWIQGQLDVLYPNTFKVMKQRGVK